MSNTEEEPAFPDAGRTFLSQPVNSPVPETPTGLTKLEYAAIHIMGHVVAFSGNDSTLKIDAGVSVDAAHALFAELEKRQ